jgi:hypothetical protein
MGRPNLTDTESLIQEVLRRIRVTPSLGGGSGTSGPATQLAETSGPTTLDIAAITDGQFLKRVGATVVSAVPPAAVALPGSFARTLAMMGA